MSIPETTVTEFVDLFSKIYARAVERNKLDQLPALFLWGTYGIGKSQSAYQLRDRLQQLTGKQTDVIDIMLLLYGPVDLKGNPVANRENHTTEWYIPQKFKLDSAPDRLHIIQFDELVSAPPTIQAAANSIILDGKIDDYQIPRNNTIFLATGNRSVDRAVTYTMPDPLANRFSHWEIHADYKGWRHWAEKAGVDDSILRFLDFDNSRLISETDEECQLSKDAWDDQLAVPRPRSWVFASRFLELTEGLPIERKKLIASCVGIETAEEYFHFIRTSDQIPDLGEIFAGNCTRAPKSPDALYMLVQSMTNYIRHEPALSYDAFENAVLYLKNYAPQDYIKVFLLDIYKMHEHWSKLEYIRDPVIRKMMKKMKLELEDEDEFS